jgi:hypothetical protein
MTSSSVIPDMLASTEEFTAFLTRRGEQVPSKATALLLGATPLVLDATMGARYGTDPATGLATDVVVQTALADATCIQALAWSKLGVDPNVGGVMNQSGVSGKKIGSASFEYVGASAVAAARADAATTLVPQAVARLRQANLIDGTAWSQG